MFVIEGKEGAGYRFFRPGRPMRDGRLRAFRLPPRRLLAWFGLANALLVFELARDRLQDRHGGVPPAHARFYLAALMLLLAELGLRAGLLWRRCLITVGPTPPRLRAAPSLLRVEHMLFWMALQLSLIASVELDHPTPGLLWEASIWFCLAMVLLPLASAALPRLRRTGG
ncbi:hypothetical protein [Fulvimonas soli]|jgi:hypothetical protein|uniref:Uncharacterized protein n=1 Tax=Fulvimonas soli TaxID=155197 RepID=A0A316IG19_9GAMM|nr:hypothetical protein [Fulvimonas soli]PWK91959.1 hypothetical protein C7456_10378 [Fulvimonas soli]TNY25142.1 hypothetical protein BV497_15380 [Fulvimonas soli]